MKKLVGLAASLVLVGGVATNAQAEINQNKLYAGGGLGFNKTSSAFNLDDNAIGFQFFGGYDLDEEITLADNIGFAAEVGYTTSGKFKFCTGCGSFTLDGLWVNAVADYKIDEEFSFLNRLGYDLGDDDGIMMGMGVEYNIDANIAVRGEIVMRGAYKSFQANALYRF